MEKVSLECNRDEKAHLNPWVYFAPMLFRGLSKPTNTFTFVPMLVKFGFLLLTITWSKNISSKLFLFISSYCCCLN